MIRTLLLGLIILFLWSSPELRSASANLLRSTADWIEPTDSAENNPKYFKIPNPFHERK